MIAAPCHGLVAIEDAGRQLSTSALCRERGGVGRSLARFPVQEDRTGGSVRRLVLERVVRDEDQLVADRSILEALATGVPRYWSATWMGAPRDRSRSAAAGAIGRRRYIGVCMSRSCGIGPVRFGHVQAVETGDRTGRASRRRSSVVAASPISGVLVRPVITNPARLWAVTMLASTSARWPAFFSPWTPWSAHTSAVRYCRTWVLQRVAGDVGPVRVGVPMERSTMTTKAAAAGSGIHQRRTAKFRSDPGSRMFASRRSGLRA